MEKKKMKAYILTTVRAPYRVGLFNELGKHNDITVSFEQEKDIARADAWYQDTFETFTTIPLKKWNRDLKILKWEIVKIVRDVRPDIVFIYEFSTRTAMLLMQYCIKQKIPYCINCDGGFIVHNLIKDKIKNYFITHAYSYIAGGEYAKEYLMAFGADVEDIVKVNFSSLYKKNILKKPVTETEKLKYKERLGIREQHTILMVGQIIYRKGIDILLKACSLLKKTDIGVYIIGGQADKEYQDLINELKLMNVHFMDFVEPPSILHYYYCADIFVLPTREDIWGLVINEAMAAGIPVITTDRCIAGLELIEDGVNGYIVPVDDEKILAGRICDLINDKDMREKMGQMNCKKIQNYSLEGMARRIESIFDRLEKCGKR